MTIAYDGGGYKGWQRLTNEPGTIQGTIERVLSRISESVSSRVFPSLSTAGTVQYLRCMNTGSIRDHVQMYLQENTVITDRCILIWIVCAKQPIT